MTAMGSSSSVLAETRRLSETFAAAQDDLRTGLREGQDGGTLAAAYSDRVADSICKGMDAPLRSAQSRFGSLALVATGGLGRGQLAPYSDIDLVILCEDPPAEGDVVFDEFVRDLVHPLWDAGARVSVLVHDAQTWLAEAADDLTLCTALLDMRPLLGTPQMVTRLRDAAFDRFFGDKRAKFLRRLEVGIQERHARYGTTVLLMEPDLKYGPGGLRDLAALGWALEATHGSVDLGQMVDLAEAPPRMASLLTSARDVLLRLRLALQLVAQRSQDRLTFQYQERMPPLLGLLGHAPVDDATLVGAIELAMQDYYRAARDLLRYGSRLRDKCRPSDATARGLVRRIDERFSIAGGQLHLREGSPAVWDSPVLALEALTLARDLGVPLSGQTFDALAEATAAPHAELFHDDPEAHRLFLDLLSCPDDTGTPTALDLCSEFGLIDRVIPQYGPIRGRMQHDPYHVYTVDQHTLGAVGMLKALFRGEHNKDFPLATAVYLEIDDPRPLYLATLCHDLGKALPGDQCETGATIAQSVATRLGFDDGVATRCGLLVREHLTMPLLSQKRDLSDPLLIAEFAATVGTRSTLRELYLLSCADMAQVRPGNLTSWKLTLLDELYLQTLSRLRRGARVDRTPRTRVPKGMPERYYSLYHLELRSHHARLTERLIGERRAAILELVSGSGALRLTLCAHDRPGLLAQAAAVFDDHGLEVLAADVFSAPGPPAVALDIFRVDHKDPESHGLDVATVTAIEELLQRDLSRTELAQPPPSRSARLWPQARVATRIVFDKDPAGARSIVEVETEIGHDVLRRITLAFAAEGLDIGLARCNTEGQKADHVFYVPVLDTAAEQQLASRLRAYLDPPLPSP